MNFEFTIRLAAVGVVMVVAVGIGVAGFIITTRLVFVVSLVFGACIVLATGIFTAVAGSASILLQI